MFDILSSNGDITFLLDFDSEIQFLAFLKY